MHDDTIRSVKDLERIKGDIAAVLAMRSDTAPLPTDGRYHVMLCFGTGCISSGAKAVKEAFVAELARKKLTKKVSLVETGCNGFCAGGPIVVIYPGGSFYHKVSADDVAEIVKDGFLAQNAFDEKDSYCAPARQVALLRMILTLYRKGRDLIEAGVPLARVRTLPCVPQLLRAKEAFGNDELDRLAELERRMQDELAALTKEATKP